jgi:hypothetical protein
MGVNRLLDAIVEEDIVVLVDFREAGVVLLEVGSSNEKVLGLEDECNIYEEKEDGFFEVDEAFDAGVVLEVGCKTKEEV